MTSKGVQGSCLAYYILNVAAGGPWRVSFYDTLIILFLSNSEVRERLDAVSSWQERLLLAASGIEA
eukprot:167843-Pleurochrysis_carterae.AAC.1